MSGAMAFVQSVGNSIAAAATWVGNSAMATGSAVYEANLALYNAMF